MIEFHWDNLYIIDERREVMLGNIFNFIAAFITLIVTLLPVFLKFNNENYDKLKILIMRI